MTSSPARKRVSIGVLVAISALQPFALNALAPATPSLAKALGIGYGAIQLSLGIYLVTVALSQLVVGPLSDRYGRRPCVLAGTLLFMVGSLLGAVATNLPLLLTARALQAAGAGTAFALARAIIRDTASRDEAASLIGYVTMVMVVVPMLAPLAGAYLDKGFGWASIFISMAAFGAVSLAVTAPLLHETAPFSGATSSVGAVFRAMPSLLADAEFRRNLWALTANSATFFAFIAAAPYIVVDVMGHGPEVYATYFILNAFGYMAGNYVTGRYGRRLGTDTLIRRGMLISLFGLTISAIVPFTSWWTPATLFVPLMINAVGNGMTTPSSTAAGLSARPDLAGSAAGIQGAISLGGGALAAVVVSLLVTVWPPALTTAMWLFLAAAMVAIHRGRFRRND